MIVYTLISAAMGSEGFVLKDKKLWYTICYVALAFFMIISIPISNSFVKR